ncbi:glucose dehydrogenase [FAD, quinone]-like [Wyeomyia smithii]|uniref:glucose dehydrogenase [FAD, quinone]-like n=1 Tax=Wyeomyia smithii TaxID=174621 RepID=UPI002467E973|nr:glucose dehydrogenase [FAD, quinone]-like [Wyeomyia smithii]
MFILRFSTWIVYVVYLVGTSIVYIFLNGSYLLYEHYYGTTVPTKQQYEYIIIGTGTAGSVIATGIPSKDVLIVEAGSMRPAIMDVPLLQPLFQGTFYDWQYRTEAQEAACNALNENRSAWPMGKVFGGSHVFNNMINYRATREDFQEWFETEEELTMFMEHFDHWGEDLSTVMEMQKFSTGLDSAFIEAAAQAGLDSSLFYRPNVTMKDGKRMTTSHHSWTNMLKSYQIVFNAEVERIIIENGHATGIIFNKNGKSVEGKASKGIILAAGTVGSTKILLQSGIGPKQHLENAGISAIIDLPVGENLQDHITTGMDLILLSQRMPMGLMDIVHPLNLWNYFFNNGQNSSISFGGCECLGFVNLGSNFTHDIGFMVLPVGITVDAGAHLRNLINLRPDVWSQYFKPMVDQNKQSVTILPILLHPKSKGYIRINNTNPRSNLIIHPNYLRNPEDVQTLITGLKILQHIIKQPAMQALGAEINPIAFPGCQNHQFLSNSYWECYIRALTLTLYHPVGTCRMGNAKDPEAVVSNRDLKVHQLDNLYVVDASVLPNLPSGNPNSVVIALANYFLNKNFPNV